MEWMDRPSTYKPQNEMRKNQVLTICFTFLTVYFYFSVLVFFVYFFFSLVRGLNSLGVKRVEVVALMVKYQRWWSCGIAGKLILGWCFDRCRFFIFSIRLNVRFYASIEFLTLGYFSRNVCFRKIESIFNYHLVDNLRMLPKISQLLWNKIKGKILVQLKLKYWSDSTLFKKVKFICGRFITIIVIEDK